MQDDLKNNLKSSGEFLKEMAEFSGLSVTDFEKSVRHAVAKNGLVAATFPKSAILKLEEFQQVLDDFGLSYKIFAATKSINSPALVGAMKNRAGIDIASLAELEIARSKNFSGQEILATGPKDENFLEKLIQDEKITISIDSVSELKFLISKKAKNPLLFRLTRSVLNMPGVTKISRFGLDAAGFSAAVSLAKKHKMNVIGMAFHLDSVQISERAFAIEKSISLIFRLQAAGFSATILDIGGGYGSSFGLEKSQADALEFKLRQQILAKQTWQGHRFGLNPDSTGNLSGVENPTSDTETARLKSILEFKIDGLPVVDILRENLIEVWLEPGSAIFNQAGFLATKIISVEKRDGIWQIVVNAQRNQVCMENNEVLFDPILVKNSENSENSENLGIEAENSTNKVENSSRKSEKYAVLGRLCAENDLLTYRLLEFEDHPAVGDILIWPNTAAYRSHFSASRSIGHPLAHKMFFDKNGELIDDL